MRSPQFWVVCTCLLAALLTIQVRGDTDRVPASAPLAEIPMRLDGLTGQDIAINADVREILGKGDFLNRVYRPADSTSEGPGSVTHEIPVQLFIAYFPTQRSGQSIHSPQNCLPGSGWTFTSSGVTQFSDQTGKQYRVGEYVISDGKDRQEVLYWYQSHGRSIASDYKAKLLMLTDSIRLGRTDAALVRVITPMLPGESQASAHARVVGFAQTVTPLLPAYIPN